VATQDVAVLDAKSPHNWRGPQTLRTRCGARTEPQIAVKTHLPDGNIMTSRAAAAARVLRAARVGFRVEKAVFFSPARSVLCRLWRRGARGACAWSPSSAARARLEVR
jgi:hypothetical protein